MENHHHDTHPTQRHHPHHFQSREILQHMDERGSHHWKPAKTLDSTPTNSIAANGYNLSSLHNLCHSGTGISKRAFKPSDCVHSY
ncbi:hypothetical protein OUZ56_002683 [Daphnia magna]|uniref:Uncharacterized protein n=1 Tax=Daphnia magna TaxID=35525 RepID=A0ABR0A6J8_9CRUS|nr:hypothetical protein OUZ56_002683 [Daphnia magna]